MSASSPSQGAQRRRTYGGGHEGAAGGSGPDGREDGSGGTKKRHVANGDGRCNGGGGGREARWLSDVGKLLSRESDGIMPVGDARRAATVCVRKRCVSNPDTPHARTTLRALLEHACGIRGVTWAADRPAADAPTATIQGLFVDGAKADRCQA